MKFKNTLFVKSFKEGKTYWKTLSLDVGWLVSIIIFVFMLFEYVTPRLAEIGDFKRDIASGNPFTIALSNPEYYLDLIYELAAFGIVLLIAFFLLYVFFKYIMWQLLANKKIKFIQKDYWKFTLINLIFLAVIAIVSWLIIKGFKQTFTIGLFILLLLFIIASSNFVYLSFIVHRNLKKTWKHYKYLFANFHSLIPPYLIILAILISLSYIAFPFFQFTETLYIIFYSLLFILWRSWSRIYIANVIKKVLNEK